MSSVLAFGILCVNGLIWIAFIGFMINPSVTINIMFWSTIVLGLVIGLSFSSLFLFKIRMARNYKQQITLLQNKWDGQ